MRPWNLRWFQNVATSPLLFRKYINACRSRGRCGPSPGADVGPVPVQMWAQSRCRRRRGAPRPDQCTKASGAGGPYRTASPSSTALLSQPHACRRQRRYVCVRLRVRVRGRRRALRVHACEVRAPTRSACSRAQPRHSTDGCLPAGRAGGAACLAYGHVVGRGVVVQLLVPLLDEVCVRLADPEVGRSRRRCGRGEPSPSADVGGVSPVPAQMWAG